jgi:outer membrane lipoprotein-sorting protein
LNRCVLGCMILATVAAICCGCGGRAVTSHTEITKTARPVALDATSEELLEKYDARARGMRTLNATAELKPTAGSKYSGVIDEYHEVKAFLLAERPAEIRMIGQAPVVGTTVFDMTSDGKMFRVSIPTKHKFLVGAVATERASSKPIENLRPQHLLDALLWPEVRKEETVLLEEYNDESARYYVLTVLRGGYQTEIFRKIWFDRADLQVARLQNYGPKGILLSDVRLSDWQPLDSSANAADSSSGVSSFPRTIHIDRPHDDYQLGLQFTRIAVNAEIPAERFQLEQPAGSELVEVGAGAENKQTTKESRP